MKKILLFLILSSTLFSCMEVMDIDIPSDEKKITLNGLISSDSVVKINLSKAINSLDGDAFIKFIDGAKVELYENDLLIETMKKDTFGYYVSTKKPELGKTYTVKVEYGSKKLQATTNLPKPISIADLDVEFSVDSSTQTWTDPDTGDSFDTTFYSYSDYSNVYVTFNDNADEHNYYLLSFSFVQANYVWDDYGNMYITGYTEVPISYQLSSSSNDDISFFTINNLMGGYFINDAFFNGQEKKLKAEISTYELLGYGYEQNDLSKSPLYVHLYSVNKDFYDFVTSYNKYQQSQGNPFSEPVNIFTNVENGVGLFAGFSVCTDTVNLLNLDN